MVSVASEDRAREALRMAESDPGRSVELAAAARQLAQVEGDLSAASVAERAWGLGAAHLNDVDAAVRHLRQAIQLGQRASSQQLAAEARMTLAGMLTWRGNPRAALREIDAALAGLTGVERARAQAQRGAILHTLGRLDEGMDSYRTALRALRRADDRVWLQRVLQNRGIAHAQRHEFAAAEADLHAAEKLCHELKLDLTLGHVHENLGFISARRGDVPTALAYLDLAEARFRLLHSHLGRVKTDRASVLLSVRLLAEARQAADEAVHQLEREARGMAVPEARLLLAQAALLDGDLPHAQQQARRAMREFTRNQRWEWAALARLTLADCKLRDERRRHQVRTRELEETAELLAHIWPEASLESQIFAARLAIERGKLDRGRRLLTLPSRRRRHGVATLRARAWYAEALRRQLDDNRRGACSAARAGLRILDEHVAGLGATDLRAHAAGHRTELAELGLRAALQDGRPSTVFTWAELGRASHLSHPPARPPSDPVLAESLAQLRATTAEIDQQRGTGRSSTRLLQQQVALERRIRDNYRRQHGAGGGRQIRPPAINDLAQALGNAALLEFIHLDSILRVLTIVDGHARLRTLGPDTKLAELIEILPFALRRLARRSISSHSRSAANDLLQDTAAELDSALLGRLPEIGDRPIVVIPTGHLQSLPWSVLPSCHGRPVTVAPSAALWWTAAHRRWPTGRVTVAAGPDLTGARSEASAVATIHHTTALTGAKATVAAVAHALDGATLAHLATHGRVRQDNPLFSALRFADGPLMVHDLEALHRAPHTVVLAACDTGRPVVRIGDELLGLGATLLAQGASQLIAPVLSVLDVETEPLMVAFHKLLSVGHPAAAALASAQQQVAAGQPSGRSDVAPFICLGAGLTAPDLRAAS
jgi:CHAT domain-containing protein/tetratricopeptide (TPR) repeat protein